MSRYPIFLLMFLALVVRLYFAFEVSLSIDELLTFEVMRLPHLRDILSHIRTNDLQMPFLYVLLFFIKKTLGLKYLVLRGLFAFISISSVYLTFKIGKILNGKLFGYYTATITALSYCYVIFSGEIRPYSLLILISCLMIWIYLEKSRWYFVWLSILSLFACSLHYYGVFLVLPYLLLEHKRIIRFISGFPLLSFLGAGTVFSFGTIVIPTVLRNYNIDHSYRPLMDPGKTFIELMNISSFLFWGPVGTLFLLISGFLYFRQKQDQFRNQNILSLAIVGLFPMILIVLKSVSSTPTIEPRYFSMFLPPLTIAACLISFSLEGRILGQGKFILLAVVLFDLLVYRNHMTARQDDSLAIFQSASNMAEKEQIPLVSCGVCFWPYASGVDNYACYRNRDVGNLPPERAVLIMPRVENDYCSHIFKNINEPVKSSSYRIFVYHAK